MQVLLQANVTNLGHIGELVTVKPGYGRNFLLPRGLAILADAKNKRAYEHQLRIVNHKRSKVLTAAQELATKVGAMSITIQKPVGEEDKIFGSVTHQELAEAFKAEGLEVDRKAISVLDDIKRVGVYRGAVKLHPEVSAEFKIWVVAKS